jgi:hypothetical protein
MILDKLAISFGLLFTLHLSGTKATQCNYPDAQNPPRGWCRQFFPGQIGNLPERVFSHPTSCQHYVYCFEDGNPCTIACPRGTFFSRCSDNSFWSDSLCVPRNEALCSGDSGTCSSDYIDLPSGWCRQNHPIFPDDRIVPHPTSCIDYVWCTTDGRTEVVQCDDPLYLDSCDLMFDGVPHGPTRSCQPRNEVICIDEPDRVNRCAARGLSPAPPSPPPPNNPPEPIYIDEACEFADPNTVSIVPSLERCDWYYICSFGKATPRECSSNLHFDVRTGRCETIRNARCHVSKRFVATRR